MVDDFSGCIANYITSNSSHKNVVPERERLSGFPHITFSVSSLSEYLEVVKLLHIAYGDNLDLAFRGVSNYEYPLEPSLKVFQKKPEFTREPFDQFYPVELELVNEMLTTRPEEFVGITSNFDLLAKMQHLGLPTRLLDFSLNPLVALYFTCQSLSENTARVICAVDSSSMYTRSVVEYVCGLYKVTDFTHYFLEDLVKDDSGILSYMGSNMEPLMAHPKHFSERIKRQSGLFMIFPNTVSDLAWFNITNREDGDYTYPFVTQQEKKRLHDIADREDPYYLYDIKKGSNLLHRDFQVTTDSFYRIRKCYQDYGDEIIERHNVIYLKDDVKWAFTERFVINAEIAEFSNEIMEKYFCSILIEARYKKSIMQELNYININEAFLFPEPEYTAKQIKNRFLD